MFEVTNGFGKPLQQQKCILVPEHEYNQLKAELASKQAKIDNLMLEYCPTEMTEDQIGNWAKHQVPADPQPKIKDLAGYEEIIFNNQLLPDHYYWVRSRRDKGTFFIAPVRNANGALENMMPALIVSNMSFWAYEGNSQALENFHIYGPIRQPFHIEVVG
jgi:hypothetical protein